MTTRKGAANTFIPCTYPNTKLTNRLFGISIRRYTYQMSHQLFHSPLPKTYHNSSNKTHAISATTCPPSSPFQIPHCHVMFCLHHTLSFPRHYRDLRLLDGYTRLHPVYRLPARLSKERRGDFRYGFVDSARLVVRIGCC